MIVEKGQTTTEAIILLPLVLFIVFCLIQACQIGMGLVMVNYAVGSVARKVAREGVSPQASAAAHQSDYDGLMIGGLTTKPLNACYDTNASNSSAVARNVVVTAQATLTAYPLIGPMLHKMAPGFETSTVPDSICTEQPVPALGFTGPPDYKFIIHGIAVVRRNYLQ